MRELQRGATSSAPTATPPSPVVSKRWRAGGFILAGFVVVGILIGGFGAWTVTTDLAGAVVAPASLSIEGERKVIQHPEGGVVEAILVEDGAVVSEGDVLIRLDGGELRAQMEIIDGQLDELTARQARLEAEMSGADVVGVSEAFQERLDQRAQAQAMLDGQIALFDARRTTLSRRLEQLTGQAEQLEQQIVGARAQIGALNQQITLIASELEVARGLLERELIERSRVIALEREEARLSGQRGALVSEIARLRGRISELEISKLEQQAARREEAISSLRDMTASVAELRERRSTVAQSLARIEIRAPQDGVILGLAVNTIGGVVRAAEPLLYIVPSAPTLVVEARIPSVSRDRLRREQAVRVLFPSFNQRTTPELNGSLARIGADALVDEQTGLSYFPVTVEVGDAEFARLRASGVDEIGPGLPAEVYIQTDARSVASYLVKPFLDFFDRAFRED